MIGIVVSRDDPASVRIGGELLDLADWNERTDDSSTNRDGRGTYYTTDGNDSCGFELRYFDELHLDLVRPDRAFDDPTMLVFASRHAGETGPLLTGHFTGNFGPAEYGGSDHSLAMACPNALDVLVSAFDEHAPPDYDVGMECTHHGPTDVGVPSLFAELGSAEPQWNDTDGARAVAKAILELEGVDPHRNRQIVGFGGGHYVPRFERIVRETPWTVGHIGSEWALDELGDLDTHRDVIEQTFLASNATIAVVDDDRPELDKLVTELGYRVVSETWLRTVEDRPLAFVEEIESELGSVDEGVRFGRIRDTTFSVIEIPQELLDTAQGIDRDRVRDLIEDRSIAFETTNGASRVGTRIAVATPEVRRELIEDVAAILRENYDDVHVESNAVVAESVTFDPELAREAGVPDGPKFGALASGESVTVDGKTITPADVTSQRVDRYEL